jgi:MFS family permease
VTRAEARFELDLADLAAVIEARQGVVLEGRDDMIATPADSTLAAGSPSSPPTEARFEFHQIEGPLRAYRRSVTVSPTAEASRRSVTQVVDFDVGIPWVSWLFAWPLRRVLGAATVRPAASAMPWWAPPARLTRRAAVSLATLCALSVLAGYVTDLLPDTMTYAAAQFHVGKTGQGVSLGVVQSGAIIALGLLVVADRRGRRSLILASGAAALLLSAAGAVTPSLSTLTASQVAASACVTAMSVALGVTAIEEMPAGGRAWGIGVIGMSYGLGSGVTLLALPLAGVTSGGWRALFALSLLGLPWLARCAHTLTESQRFENRQPRHQEATPTKRLSPLYRRRLVVLGAGALLLALFTAPAGQFENEYLRTQRHYSALSISALEQVVGTLGGLGTIVGSRLADRRGRRPVAAVTLAVGSATALAVYFSGGALLWVAATASSWCSYAVAPVLGVYGGELFPTSIRGRAGGVLTIVASAGGLIGLVLTGVLSSAIGTIGPALAVLAVSQVALVALVLRAYPETAGVELEDLYDAHDCEQRPAKGCSASP